MALTETSKAKRGSSRGTRARSRRTAGTSASLTKKVYDRIRNDIITCAMEPGREVSEAELAARFDVSKTPVREALGTLRTEGFIKTFPRRGYQIVPVTLSDLNELFDLRSILEGGAAELAVKRITDAELDRLEKLADVAYDRSEQPSLKRFIQANRDFHAAIAEASGNERLHRLLVRHLDELERLFYLGARKRDINTEVRGEHRHIVEVLRTRNPEAARRIMVEHNALTRQSLVALLTDSRSSAGFTI